MNSSDFRNLTSPDYGRCADHQHKRLQGLVRPHIESFNFMVEEGLSYAISNIPNVEFKDQLNRKMSLFYQDVTIAYPSLSEVAIMGDTLRVFPSECRQKGTTYKAKVQVTVGWKVDNTLHSVASRVIGQIPIMVKSARCSLHGLSPYQLAQRSEEMEEMGGYFIINGIEKVIRMIVTPRRNYPLAFARPSWKGKGSLFTEYGVIMRSVRRDQSAELVTLHYVLDGTCTLAVTKNRENLYIPIIFILKALVTTTDQNIYSELVKGRENEQFVKSCALSMLRQGQDHGIVTQHDALKYLGDRLRIKAEVAEWYSVEDVARSILKQHICVHLDSNLDKFNLIIFMIRKLLSLVSGQCMADSSDSPMNQEVLLGGHLYLTVLKEKLDAWLRNLRTTMDRQLKDGRKGKRIDVLVSAVKQGPDVGRQMEYMLATGNVVSRSSLSLPQVNGLSVVAEKINFYRFLSHFRCLHRGAYFAKMRTTAVRKLLPESYGFICPVHTPDGAPCGLLNHLAALCEVTNTSPPVGHLPRLLSSYGMIPLGSAGDRDSGDIKIPVLLNGRLIGSVGSDIAQQVADQLRMLKVQGQERVPKDLEIAFIPKTDAGLYAGFYLFSTPARLIRPVHNLRVSGAVEMIGVLEQVYLDIAVCPEEIYEGVTTHLELKADSLLSIIAKLTPFSDFNQSPRNMYQCQMGKQTMGTPAHTIKNRADTKLYQIQTPQTPIVRPAVYTDYQMDEYPIGTNAVVAVIAYTGYDMEDAMVINKASAERGFAYGSIYKSEIVDLAKKATGSIKQIAYRFGVYRDDSKTSSLEHDGLPAVGSIIKEGDPLYCYIDQATGEAKVATYTSPEIAFVDDVKLLGDDYGTGELQRVLIKLRIPRSPNIGDKFSSRHGQKGVCSMLWPSEDMPFSESGIVPDIIFNPHGFPSRMTIGMMIESMAGKSAALHGLCHDATPFTFSEDNSAIDYFGKCLQAAGYNYFGNERMYSGITGREFEADIFIGNIYYQRLRHMVADKFQVRTTGPIDQLTHQPVQGKRNKGGIRFGEMERDALLAHGTSFLLQDRLLNCSDRSVTQICTSCGSILSPVFDQAPSGAAAKAVTSKRRWRCKVCQSSDHIETLAIPYVCKYLIAELAAMNIKVTLDVK